MKRLLPFTTAYHTRFPEYVAARLPVSPAFVWRFIRWFHRPARHIMVATRSLQRELAQQGLEQTMMWERGVDHVLFHADRTPHPAFEGLARPIQLYVGRVAVEKNIGAFLDTRQPGTKVIVGDGPALAELQAASSDEQKMEAHRQEAPERGPWHPQPGGGQEAAQDLAPFIDVTGDEELLGRLPPTLEG